MTEYQAVVFFDLDNTLLNEQHTVDRPVLDALETLKENNILPVIATGRSVAAVSDVLDLTGIDSIVAMNGQYVEIGREPVYRRAFDIDLLNRLTDFCTARSVALAMYNAYEVWATEYTEVLKRGYASINLPAPPLEPLRHRNDEVLMALALSEDENDDVALRAAFPELAFFRNIAFSVDIVFRDISKRTGIEHVLSSLKNPDIPTFAFGDGPNDVDMIQSVSHGIAMGNAVEETKSVAEFITSDFREDGIVRGLQHFGLI